MNNVARRMGKDIDKPFLVLIGLILFTFAALCHRVIADGVEMVLIYQAIGSMAAPFTVAYLIFWFYIPNEERGWVIEPTWKERIISALLIYAGHFFVNTSLKTVTGYYQIKAHESSLPFFFLALIGVGFYINLRFKNLYVFCTLFGFYIGLMRNMI